MEIGSIEFVGSVVGTLVLILITTSVKSYFTGQKAVRDNVAIIMGNMEAHDKVVKALSDGINRALKVVKWWAEESGKKFPDDLF